MADNSATLEKIRRLLALATSSNEYEAAAAAAKAQELLFKHNLDMAQIKDEDDDNDVGMLLYPEVNQDAWRASLIDAVARATGCRVVRDRGASASFTAYTLFGQPANIKVVIYLYEYLARELDRLAPKGIRIGQDWRLGAISAIGAKLQATLTEFAEASPDTRALVTTTNQLVANRMRQQYPNLVSSRGPSVRNGAAYEQGRQAGENIALRRALETDRNPAGQRLLA